MTIDRAWVYRNLGFDPTVRSPPRSTFAFAAAAAASPASQDWQREIIDFNSEGTEGREFLAFTTATGLSRFEDIPWPNGLQPKTGPQPAGAAGGPLPKADVLVVTWTVDEGHALSRVLTPGKNSRNDYVAYTHNYETISRKMRAGCPAVEAKRLGAYWTTTIGAKTVVVFKSDSHLSQDTKTAPAAGQTLPNQDLWTQIIAEVRPELVLTTGTSGGIGAECEVGDVIVSPIVRFDCQKWLQREPFGQEHFTSKPAQTEFFATARTLFNANANQLPKDNTRPPKIVDVTLEQLSSSVVTTDFFGFDTSDNHFKLQDLGSVSEMGDGVLGLVAQAMGAAAPSWLAVRNVSDPQIKSDGLSLKQQEQIAAQIYKGYGRWSTVCSAIVCWALIAAM